MKLSSITAFVFLLAGCSKSLKPQQLFTDVKELSSDKYQGRKTGTEGSRKAAEYIISRFKEIGLKPFHSTYKYPFNVKAAVKGCNIAGYISGKNDNIILISAHYDHLGMSGNAVYNGADDNASGVAGLLAIAKYFSQHKPENTLVFVSFDAEELGLQGSKAFAAAPPFTLNRVKLNINLDMISRADKGEIYAAGSYHFPRLKKFLISENPKMKVLPGHDDPALGKEDWTSQSDHSSFFEKNIPFIYFGVEDHPDYHKTSDDYERINKECFQSAADVILNIVTAIDRQLNLQNSFREKLIMKE